jgi:hypothetical protein
MFTSNRRGAPARMNRRDFVISSAVTAAAFSLGARMTQAAAATTTATVTGSGTQLTLDQLRTGKFTGTLFGSSVPPGMTLPQREQLLGHVYTIEHGYSNGGFASLNTPSAGHILAQTLSSGSKSGTWVQDANAGKLDATYAAMRDKIKAPTFIILWQEFNGHWETTYPDNYGGPAVFVKAWRRMALILKQNPNVIMCWSPNIYAANSKTSPIDPAACYPGSDVVDWVAFDGYCHGSYHSFDQLFAQAIRDYGPNGVRHKHPFMVGETAAASSLTPDKYVTSVHQSLLSGAGHGAVKALLWFDNAWGTNGYNVDATAAELKAYKALIGDTALRAA